MVVEVVVAGETLIARPDRTLFWPRERVLFVADVHLGKGTAMRAAGLPVPTGSTEASLHALSGSLSETGATHLAILGDFFHARTGRSNATLSATAAWRRSNAQVRMTLIEGNHDRRSGSLPEEFGIDEVSEPWMLGPFALRHYPEPCPGGYVLAGHLHPAARLEGPARQGLKLPCFWFGPEVGVLPAFGALTGCVAVAPKVGDRVCVIAEEQVLVVS